MLDALSVLHETAVVHVVEVTKVRSRDLPRLRWTHIPADEWGRRGNRAGEGRLHRSDGPDGDGKVSATRTEESHSGAEHFGY